MHTRCVWFQCAAHGHQGPHPLPSTVRVSTREGPWQLLSPPSSLCPSIASVATSVPLPTFHCPEPRRYKCWGSLYALYTNRFDLEFSSSEFSVASREFPRVEVYHLVVADDGCHSDNLIPCVFVQHKWVVPLTCNVTVQKALFCTFEPSSSPVRWARLESFIF